MKTLLCFGDSNTHGTMPMHELSSLGRFSPQHRWTGLLAQKLPQWQVISEGHPGRTTLHDDPIEGEYRNGARILLSVLESHRPIDLVLLKLGTNDLKYRFSVGPVDIALSLEKLVRMIRASGCGPMGGAPQVMLVAPPPIREVGVLAEIFAGGEEKSQRLGPEIAKVSARNGLPFIDLAGLIEVSAVDGIHYELEANEIMAEAFAQTIRQHFE